jgi:hypothetical protein
MKAIKNFIASVTKFNEPKEVDDNNPLTNFLNTLTQEEKDGAFLKLSSDNQANYVKAMAAFQMEAMRNVDEASIKALTMLAIKLHKSNIDEFEISQTFAGTKEGLKEEEFTIKLTKITEVPEVTPGVQYADGTEKAPKKKTSSLIEQDNAIFDLIEKLDSKLEMKPVNELPLRVSGLLLTAEFMSQTNIQNLNATLEGLMDGDTNLNASYKVEATRKEVELDLNNTSKPKLK